MATADMSQLSADPSQLKSPLQLGVTGLRQLLQCYQVATEDVRTTLLHECDVIVECRVCRSLYRGLPNFLAHKSHYCKEKCHVNIDKQSYNVADEIIVDRTRSTSSEPASKKRKSDEAIRIDKSQQINAVIPKASKPSVQTFGQFLTHHRLIRLDNNSCLLCRARFVNFADLKDHFEQSHVEAKSFTACPCCDLVFSSKSTLQEHVQKDHPLVKEQNPGIIVDKYVIGDDNKWNVYDIPQIVRSPKKSAPVTEVEPSDADSSKSEENIVRLLTCALVGALGDFDVNLTSNVFRCGVHKRSFQRYSNIIQHIVAEHCQRELVCPKCPKKFAQLKLGNFGYLSDLGQHLSRDHGLDGEDFAGIREDLQKAVLKGHEAETSLATVPKVAEVESSPQTSPKSSLPSPERGVRLLEIPLATTSTPFCAPENPVTIVVPQPVPEPVVMDTDLANNNYNVNTEVVKPEDVSTRSNSRSSSRHQARSNEDGVTSTFSLDDLVCPRCFGTFPLMRNVLTHLSAVHRVSKEGALTMKGEIRALSQRHRQLMLQNLGTRRPPPPPPARQRQRKLPTRLRCPSCPKLYSTLAQVLQHLEDTHSYDANTVQMYRIQHEQELGNPDGKPKKNSRKQGAPAKRALTPTKVIHSVTARSRVGLVTCESCHKTFGKQTSLELHQQTCGDAATMVTEISPKEEPVDPIELDPVEVQEVVSLKSESVTLEETEVTIPSVSPSTEPDKTRRDSSQDSSDSEMDDCDEPVPKTRGRSLRKSKAAVPSSKLFDSGWRRSQRFGRGQNRLLGSGHKSPTKTIIAAKTIMKTRPQNAHRELWRVGKGGLHLCLRCNKNFYGSFNTHAFFECSASLKERSSVSKKSSSQATESSRKTLGFRTLNKGQKLCLDCDNAFTGKFYNHRYFHCPAQDIHYTSSRPTQRTLPSETTTNDSDSEPANPNKKRKLTSSSDETESQPSDEPKSRSLRLNPRSRSKLCLQCHKYYTCQPSLHQDTCSGKRGKTIKTRHSSGSDVVKSSGDTKKRHSDQGAVAKRKSRTLCPVASCRKCSWQDTNLLRVYQHIREVHNTPLIHVFSKKCLYPYVNCPEHGKTTDEKSETTTASSTETTEVSQTRGRMFCCPECNYKDNKLSVLNFHLERVHGWNRSQCLQNQAAMKVSGESAQQ